MLIAAGGGTLSWKSRDYPAARAWFGPGREAICSDSVALVFYLPENTITNGIPRERTSGSVHGSGRHRIDLTEPGLSGFGGRFDFSCRGLSFNDRLDEIF